MSELVTPPVARSYLFAPGSNDRLLGKVFDAGADAVVLDLEDAVPAAEKARARTAVGTALAERTQPAGFVYVRINRDGDGWSEDDLAAVVTPSLHGVMLAKAEEPDAVAAVDRTLATLEHERRVPSGGIRIICLVESAVGVLRAEALAGSSPRVARLGFGSLDFLADIGAGGDGDGPATQHARGHLVLASRAAGIGAPIDGVHPILDDERGLAERTARARDLGFFGKLVIHPRQLEPVHRVFTPTPEQIADARALVEDFAASEAAGRAAYAADGSFVDPAVVARARALLAVADLDRP